MKLGVNVGVHVGVDGVSILINPLRAEAGRGSIKCLRAGGLGAGIWTGMMVVSPV